MATQVKASDSSAAGAPKGNSAMDALSSAFDELAGSTESQAGQDMVDAADSLEEGEDDIDLDELDAETDEEAGDEEGEEDPDESDAEREAEKIADELTGGDGKKGKDKGEKLKIEVTDETGKRVLEFDPTDTKAVTRAVQQAAGARKLYATHQTVKAELASVKQQATELGKVAASMTKLEGIYESQGIDGVVRLLEGKGIEDLVKEAAAFQAWYQKATPAERAAYDSKKVQDKAARDIAAANDRATKAETTAKQREEQAAVERLEGYAHAEFGRHSFKGKLGDKAQELRMDKVLWNNIQSELDALERAGTKLTAAVVKQVAADTASVLGATVKKAVDKGVKKAVDKKKEAATNKAQSRMIKSDARAERAVDNQQFDLNSTTSIANLMAASLRSNRGSRGRKK